MTKIEWCDETRNPVKGLCRYGCDYCYARKIQRRFHFPGLVSLELTVFSDLPKSPRDVFVGSMHDILGEWIPDAWIQDIIACCEARPLHRYFFLSKNPARFALFKWPRNSWLGTSAENREAADKRLADLRTSRHPNLFVSFEPILDRIAYADLSRIKWVIIGGLSPRPRHEKEWVEKLAATADAVGIPVFIKDNAQHFGMRRQKPPLVWQRPH
jgi:protein gp37